MTGRSWNSLVPLDQTGMNPSAMVAGCAVALRKSPLFPTSERRGVVVEVYLSLSKVSLVHMKGLARVHAGRRCISIGVLDHQVRLRPGHRHPSGYLFHGR